MHVRALCCTVLCELLMVVERLNVTLAVFSLGLDNLRQRSPNDSLSGATGME